MWLGTIALLGDSKECVHRLESEKVSGVGEWVRKGQRPRVECQRLMECHQTRKVPRVIRHQTRVSTSVAIKEHRRGHHLHDSCLHKLVSFGGGVVLLDLFICFVLNMLMIHTAEPSFLCRFQVWSLSAQSHHMRYSLSLDDQNSLSPRIFSWSHKIVTSAPK